MERCHLPLLGILESWFRVIPEKFGISKLQFELVLFGPLYKEFAELKLVSLKLQNFRCYRDLTTINFDDLTVLIGKNDSGKSSILDALDIFFEASNVALEREDLCVNADSKEIVISCIFEDLPQSVIIDSNGITSFESEYLLNSDGRLEIQKRFNCAAAKPKLQVVIIANHPTRKNFDDLLSLSNGKLKTRAVALHVDLSDVNQTINKDLRRAIWDSAPSLDMKVVPIDAKAESAKAVWEQVKKYMPIFSLFKSDRASTDQDAEAQDPMKMAIKEAIAEKQEELALLTEVVKKQVQQIADSTVKKIAELDPALASELNPDVSTRKWDSLFSVSLTGEDKIPINKRGSGTRRLILLSFFRAQVERNATSSNKGVIYAIEEPETSQHPMNQLMLVEAFEELSEISGNQLILTTHNPMLSRKFKQDSLRLISRTGNIPTIRDCTENNTIEEIVNSLGVLPDHDVKVFVGVEGRNDINFLKGISKILADSGENIPNLCEEEESGRLVFIPLGGSNLDLWISRLRGLNRREFYLMDRDNEPPLPPKYQRIHEKLEREPNCHPYTLKKRELENYIHIDAIRSEVPGYSGSISSFEDVPYLFAKAVHEQSSSSNSWDDVLNDERKLREKESKAKKRLNHSVIKRMTPEKLTEIDADDEIRKFLTYLGQALTN